MRKIIAFNFRIAELREEELVTEIRGTHKMILILWRHYRETSRGVGGGLRVMSRGWLCSDILHR